MKVAVVKYNAGNIRSVDYALKRLGVEAVITADKEILQSASIILLVILGFECLCAVLLFFKYSLSQSIG